MATTIVLCRVCLSSIDKNHSVDLFSGRSESDWPRRLSTLLCVSVRESDVFCHWCKRNVENVETKLSTLRQQIQASYRRFSSELNSSRKHTTKSK